MQSETASVHQSSIKYLDYLSQEPMTCIELSPYFGNKITHEIYYFRSALVTLVRQALPKGRGRVEHQKVADDPALGPGRSAPPRLD
jgi:hypothetical protein